MSGGILWPRAVTAGGERHSRGWFLISTAPPDSNAEMPLSRCFAASVAHRNGKELPAYRLSMLDFIPVAILFFCAETVVAPRSAA